MTRHTLHHHPATKPDARLLLEAREGYGESFGLLFRRHHEAVLAYLGCRVREPELAADLMAETFASLLVLVQDADRPLPPVPIAWLLVTARHLLIDGARRGVVDDRARQRLAVDPLALDDDDLRRVEEIAAETDLLARLREQLEPDQFRALCARVFEERDYADIAAEFNCSESVVRKRVSRALRVLRRVKETSYA